jgi:hypothetical protein
MTTHEAIERAAKEIAMTPEQIKAAASEIARNLGDHLVSDPASVVEEILSRHFPTPDAADGAITEGIKRRGFVATPEVIAAMKRWRSVNPSYIPVYPGGQKQFDADCQSLAVAYMTALSIPVPATQEVQGE